MRGGKRITANGGLTADFAYKAIEDAVFGSDTWRSDALALLVIAHTGDVASRATPTP